MKPTLTIVAGVCALTMICGVSVHAAVAPAGPAVAVRPLPVTPFENGSIAVQVDRAVINDLAIGDAVSFGMIEGQPVIGEIVRRFEKHADRYSMTGTLVNDEAGSFVLAVHNDAVVIEVRSGDDVHRVRTAGPDLEVLETLAGFDVQGCGVDAKHEAPIVDGGIAGDCADGSVIDVLVVYSPQARQGAGGINAIGAIIDAMVTATNDAYLNSGINTTVNLVYATEIPYNENAEHLSVLTNPNDGIIDEVHDLREVYGADMTAMLVANAGYCGIAWLMTSLSPGFEANAFSVTVWSCSSLVFTHELGHNQGCCHAPGDGGGCFSGGLFEYSVGYRFNGDGGNLWRTVMAYSPGARIPYLSNPDVLFDGQPTGVPANDPDGADNTLTINTSAPLIANFRCNDGICEDLDLPPFPESTDCNENYIPDACEVALGIGEDDNESGILDDCERPINDTCLAAELLFDGIAPITNDIALNELGAEECGAFERDVWFRYAVQCVGTAVIDVCDADFTPEIAVYTGCPDDDGEMLACSGTPCDAGGPIVIEVTPGIYRIRVGGATEADYGTAMLSLTCTPGDCPADFDNSGSVDVLDLTALLGFWGTNFPAYDIAPDGGDGVVDVLDLFALLSAWGQCD